MALDGCIVECVYNFPFPFVEMNAFINKETKIAIERGEKTVEEVLVMAVLFLNRRLLFHSEACRRYFNIGFSHINIPSFNK
jgi:hypothetical protein